MHELAIAQQVVRTVLSEMHRTGATAVRRIDMEIGALEGIPPERLYQAFDLESKDTPLEGVELRVALVPSVATCPACGAKRELTTPSEAHGADVNLSCLECGGALEFRGGRGFVVRSAAMVLPDP
jgi:hydrogenase nickel insertion protein HypA